MLFYDIQGYFDKTYSGRYFAHLLAELFRQSPVGFSNVLRESGIDYSYKDGDKIFANGWRLRATNRIRFADIAVLNSAGDPLVLAEIKDADIKNEGNSAQLDDYLTFIGQKRNSKVEFLFLSRTTPPEKDELKLQNSKNGSRIHQMLFRQLYGPLRGNNPFCRMLRDYLEDIDVVYRDQKPDAKTLQYVTRSMFGIGGRRATERSIPEYFDTVFGNLFSLGQWVQTSNPSLFKQGFKRRLYVEPWHDVQKIEKAIVIKDGKKSKSLWQDQYLGDYCNGGEVDFYTCGYLTYKGGKVYLEFGYWSDVEKKQKKSNAYRYSSGIYANIQWKPWKLRPEDSVEKSATLKMFPNEEAFQKELRKFLKSTKNAILKRKKCPADIKRVLRQFKIP